MGEPLMSKAALKEQEVIIMYLTHTQFTQKHQVKSCKFSDGSVRFPVRPRPSLSPRRPFSLHMTIDHMPTGRNAQQRQTEHISLAEAGWKHHESYKIKRVFKMNCCV